LIEPFYDQIYKDYPTKGLIRLAYGDNYCVINQEGKLVEGKFASYEQMETLNYDDHESAEQYTLPTNEIRKKHKKKKRARWM
jgi:hypothetical protein